MNSRKTVSNKIQQWVYLFWLKIKLYMDNSAFFVFIEATMKFIASFFASSIFVKYVSKEINSFDLENTLIYKAMNGFFNIFKFIGNKFLIQAFENSRIVLFIRNLPSFLLNLRIRDIGFTVFFTLVNFFIHKGTIIVNPYTIFFSLVFVFSVLINTTVYEALKGSFIYKIITTNIEMELPQIDKKTNKLQYLIFSLITGVYIGFLIAKLPFIYAIVGIIAIPSIILVLSYPFVGIMGVVFVAPFIPTMLVAAMLGGIFVCFLFKLATDNTYHFRLDLVGIFISLFILITMFKGVTSYAMHTSIKIALITTLFMISYFLVVSLIDTYNKFKVTIFSFSASAALTGLYGIYQKISGIEDKTWVDKELFEGLKLRVFSTFGNPNVYGEYLLLAIPICLVGVFISKKLIFKLYYLAVSNLLILNLGLTYSRGCYLALALSVLVFILFMEKRLVALFSAGIFILPVILPRNIILRLASITNFEDSSTSYRISIWQATVRILQDFWFTGLGQGIDAYNKVYPLYAFNGVSAPHSHNLYLQIFVETGIFGIAVFLAVLFCFYRTLVPFFYKAKNITDKIFSAALMGMMAGFLLQAFFDYVFYNYKVFLLFFIVLGITVAYCNLSKIQKGMAN